jgi:hypothetical protein
MFADTLLNIVLADGIALNECKQKEVREQINEAIENNHLAFIKDYGFFTWQEKCGSIFINNLFIKSDYRKANNLLKLRGFFKKKYPNLKFCWRNRKKQRRVQYA